MKSDIVYFEVNVVGKLYKSINKKVCFLPLTTEADA